MRKVGQSEIFSVVLITAVLISLVAAAYFWGVPLVNKRATIGKFTLASTFVTQLNEKILKIVNAGSGTEALDIPLGSVRIVPEGAIDPRNNSIILEFISNQPLALGEDAVYIGATSFTDTTSEVGTYREAQPGVITLNSTGQGTQFRINVTVHYRELDTTTTPPKGYKIALQTTSPRGTQRLRLSYDGIETQENGAANGGDLILTKINIEVI